MAYKWDNKKPTAQMLGRWQPFHDGHYTLFKEIIKKTGQVCIQIRDVQGVDDNPFDFETVKKNIEELILGCSHYPLIYDFLRKKLDLKNDKIENYYIQSHKLGIVPKNLNQLDLKRSAYRQLLNENIPSTNIDISNLCTYKLKNEFNSWRRSKTFSRQWNFICS